MLEASEGRGFFCIAGLCVAIFRAATAEALSAFVMIPLCRVHACRTAYVEGTVASGVLQPAPHKGILPRVSMYQLLCPQGETTTLLPITYARSAKLTQTRASSVGVDVTLWTQRAG